MKKNIEKKKQEKFVEKRQIKKKGKLTQKIVKKGKKNEEK